MDILWRGLVPVFGHGSSSSTTNPPADDVVVLCEVNADNHGHRSFFSSWEDPVLDSVALLTVVRQSEQDSLVSFYGGSLLLFLFLLLCVLLHCSKFFDAIFSGLDRQKYPLFAISYDDFNL